jgi:hypothetical protein
MTLAALRAAGAKPDAEQLGRHAAAFGGGERPPPFSRPRTWAALIAPWRGELGGARVALESELRDAERNPTGPDRALLAAACAQLELHAGRLDRSREHLQGGTIGDHAQPQAVGAALLSITGQPDEARTEARRALATAIQRGDFAADALARATLARLRLWESDPAGAVRLLDPLTRELDRRGLREPGIWRVIPDSIEARLGTGDIERARADARAHQERADTLRHPSALAAARRSEALVALAAGESALRG